MSGEIDVTNPASPTRILMVIANPATSTTLGIPVGFWGAELTHSWSAFKGAGYDVTIASPDGGKCELDAWSDPRDESKYSFGDLITMGFLNTPEYMDLIENTPALRKLNYSDYDASSSSEASRRCSASATTRSSRMRYASSTRPAR